MLYIFLDVYQALTLVDMVVVIPVRSNCVAAQMLRRRYLPEEEADSETGERKEANEGRRQSECPTGSLQGNALPQRRLKQFWTSVNSEVTPQYPVGGRLHVFDNSPFRLNLSTLHAQMTKTKSGYARVSTQFTLPGSMLAQI